MGLEIVPVSFSEAAEFVEEHHAHHGAPQGWKFGCGVEKSGELVGVVMVGRPVSRHYDDGRTLEVNRCCTTGAKNAASKLYAAAWRAARALGYERLITYTLAGREDGTSLVAAGWDPLHRTEGGSWSRESRPREDDHPTEPKLLWEAPT